MTGKQETTPVVLVKWKTPEDELVNIARIAEALGKRDRETRTKVCIAVPNNAWTSQMARSCRMLDIPAVPYMPVRRLQADAQAAIAAIDFLARPDAASRAKLVACGKSNEECEQLLASYGNAHGFSLLRATGMRDAKQLAHAVAMFTGDEDATTISTMAHEQLEHPHALEDSDEIAIMDYRALHGSFDYLLCVSCVDGLVGSTGTEDATALDAFEALPSHAKRGLFISYFTRIDKTTADQARIRYARCKTENGRQLAMSRPTPFLALDTSHRPSTTSGQALLRTYGLN